MGTHDSLFTSTFRRVLVLASVFGVCVSSPLCVIAQGEPSTTTSTSDTNIGFISLPEDESTTVFTTPGLTPHACARSWFQFGSQPCSDTLDSGTEVEVGEARVIEILDPSTGLKRAQNYYRIKYRRTPTDGGPQQNRAGWILGEVVSLDPDEPARRAQTSSPDCETEAGQPETLRGANAVAQVARAVNGRATDRIAEQLAPHLGKCLNPNPSVSPTLASGTSAFDRVVAHAGSVRLPSSIQSINHAPITQKQFLEIDALARTIYGEMASCSGLGSHYLAAVAAIAKNRERALIENHRLSRQFVRNPTPGQSALTEVLSEPLQFSTWNRTMRAPGGGSVPNPSLRQVLCPPARPQGRFWAAATPGPYEQETWGAIIKVATQAVLDPENFRRRTSQVSQYFYTSGLGSFYNSRKAAPTPRIDGTPLSASRCIELWEEPTAGNRSARGVARDTQTPQVRPARPRASASRQAPGTHTRPAATAKPTSSPRGPQPKPARGKK